MTHRLTGLKNIEETTGDIRHCADNHYLFNNGQLHQTQRQLQ